MRVAVPLSISIMAYRSCAGAVLIPKIFKMTLPFFLRPNVALKGVSWHVRSKAVLYDDVTSWLAFAIY